MISQTNDLKLMIKMAKRSKIATRNNIIGQSLKDSYENLRKKLNPPRDKFHRELIQDTGFLIVEDGKVTIRERVFRSFKKHVNGVDPIVSKIKSRFDKKGTLLSREVDRGNDLFVDMEKMITIEEKNGKYTSNIKYKKDNKLVNKIIEKGKPTKYFSINLSDLHKDSYQEILQENYAHLNKSDLRLSRTVFDVIKKDGIESSIPRRNTVILKDGTKIIRSASINEPVISVITESAHKHYRTADEVKDILASFSDEIKAALFKSKKA